MTRYDKHPNSFLKTVTQLAANQAITEALEFFEPVPIGRSKSLIAEILRINIQCDGGSPGVNNEVSVNITDSVTDKSILRYHARTNETATDRGGDFWTHQYDLSDGQGNGILVTKAPNVNVSSSNLGAPCAAIIQIYWRFVEVTNTELVQLLGGV